MKINKIALALGGALVFFATTLNAQEQPWSLGVKAGGSMSSLRGLDELYPAKVGKDDVDYKASSRTYFAGGLTAGYAFHENVGVGLEVLYAGLGGELATSNKLPDNASDDAKKANQPKVSHIHSHNVVIPVMLKLFPMGCDPDEGILTVDLGLQAVWPLGVAFEKKGNGDKDKFEAMKDADGKEIDKSKIVNPLTMGVITGISYEFPEIGLTLEGRYHFGLVNLFKDDAKTYRKEKLNLVDGKNVKDNYATVSLGYNFARLLMD
jgi:hypothetical protein